MRIYKLPVDVANKIAAGEVVERPASVVKELVENSVDAGALNVSVEIAGGGLGLIRVVDDGAGMDREDAVEAFERHATSKIRNAEELFHVNTLGFRGEALPSIAAVSKVRLVTRQAGSDEAWRIEMEAGNLLSQGPASGSLGTAVEVEGLFFNTPARLKYLKSRLAEDRRVEAAVEKLALSNPGVCITLSVEGEVAFRSIGDGNQRTAARAVLGRLAEQMSEGSASSPGIEAYVLVSGPKEAKKRRQDQFIIVNGRPVSSAALSAAIDRGLEGVKMPFPYPPAVVWLEIDPSRVDVNVHPAKAEVRFADEAAVFGAVRAAVIDAVTSSMGIAVISTDKEAGWGYEGEEGQMAPTAAGESIRKKYSGYFTGDEGSDALPSWSVKDAKQGPERDQGFIRTSGRMPEDAGFSQALPISEKTSEAGEVTVIGQFKMSYIIAEAHNSLMIIDQHVAHERILVDRFLKMLAEGKLMSQNLLMPLTVELMPSEAAVLKEEQETLKKLGFDVEPFGSRNAILRAVPTIGGREPSSETLLIEALRDLAEDRREGNDVGQRMRRTAVEMACKGAIKAGSVMDIKQMKDLVRDLFMSENPNRCPHGRPIILKVDMAGIERGIGRK